MNFSTKCYKCLCEKKKSKIDFQNMRILISIHRKNNHDLIQFFSWLSLLSYEDNTTFSFFRFFEYIKTPQIANKKTNKNSVLYLYRRGANIFLMTDVSTSNLCALDSNVRKIEKVHTNSSLSSQSAKVLLFRSLKLFINTETDWYSLVPTTYIQSNLSLAEVINFEVLIKKL